MIVGTGKFQLTSIEEKEITPNVDAAIKHLLCECFPKDIGVFGKTRYWHGCAPQYSVVHMKDGNVLGHIGIVVREITCDGTSVKVAGIQNMAVAVQMRGTGLSGMLISHAMDVAAAKDIKHGMLFCSYELERFYASQGWQARNARVNLTCGENTVADIEKHIYMIKDLSSEIFPDCTVINLNGLDW